MLSQVFDMIITSLQCWCGPFAITSFLTSSPIPTSSEGVWNWVHLQADCFVCLVDGHLTAFCRATHAEVLSVVHWMEEGNDRDYL